jgi:hypothetical protein
MSGYGPPVGYHYGWVPDVEISSASPWELVTHEDAKPCRYTVANHETCKRPSVARLRRKTQWWHYCEQHLYGRRIRAGVVESRVLLPDGPEEEMR